ncbi:MAG: hypothetical protein KJP06_06460 [Deltaproteobacteria bacterium]|nr:hypothetical protein [Deltaproteobacteria bacterium]
MAISNKDRQRKWRQKKAAGGMRSLTVLLPAEIKGLIDRKRKESGATIARIIETAVINWLGDSQEKAYNYHKIELNQKLKKLSIKNIQQMGADLKAIATRFEKMTDQQSAVTPNNNSVTSEHSKPTKSVSEDVLTTKIYRLVRLLNNMDVSADEIAQTLNKRKFKTLSGSDDWKAGDVQAVLKDIHRKYGHINPLFSITNPC